VAHWLELEEEAGLNNAETYKIFAERAKKSKEDFLNFIGKIKAQGKAWEQIPVQLAASLY